MHHYSQDAHSYSRLCQLGGAKIRGKYKHSFLDQQPRYYIIRFQKQQTTMMMMIMICFHLWFYKHSCLDQQPKYYIIRFQKQQTTMMMMMIMICFHLWFYKARSLKVSEALARL